MKGFATGILLAAISTMLISPSCSPDKKDAPDNNKFVVGKGTNISHWLSQSKRRGEERAEYFTKSDVEYLDSLGFDHLRLPVDEEQLWDEEGNKEPEAFKLLHNAINWCLESGLRVIVDLHIIRSHHFNAKEKPLFDDPAEQEKLADLWRQLSAELDLYPNDMVAYELLNEAVADDPEDWNQIVALVSGAIRELEPERTIVIGSNRWQSVDTFDELKIPENDQNIMLSFHFYLPFALTHYRASWTHMKDYTGPVQYPGQTIPEEGLEGMDDEIKKRFGNSKIWNIDSLEAKMVKPIKYAKEKGLPLYCGEWGCIQGAPEEDMLRWYSDMQKVFARNDIAWANWDYKGSFGIKRGEDHMPQTELINILLKQD